VKMSINRLEGETMGTHWSVLMDGAAGVNLQTLHKDLQAAVDSVNCQMSTWNPDSDLMRFNAAPCGEWHHLPAALMAVLAAALDISRLTDNAFELNLGDATKAWGFQDTLLDLGAIRMASAAPRVAATDALELDSGLARKSAPLALDLSGIAKGYAVDCLADVMGRYGVARALCALDGELRAIGSHPWPVAIAKPDRPDTQAHSILDLSEGAVATSGDYRHFVMVKGQRLSHTMDPRRAAPLINAPASVTVLANNCIYADAMATALMVMGADQGTAFARSNDISALFLIRQKDGFGAVGTGSFAQTDG
jgi:FAD:protein FMN transferase